MQLGSEHLQWPFPATAPLRLSLCSRGSSKRALFTEEHGHGKIRLRATAHHFPRVALMPSHTAPTKPLTITVITALKV
jgi:hypothetical protein